MRALPAALQAALDSGATTLCRCWQVTRSDGAVLGFTDHDLDLVFDGVTHLASSGLSAGAAELSTGLSVDSQAVSGALSADAMTEADIALGLYDNALVRQWLVDWRDASVRALLGAGRIGEIRRTGAAFEAEIVGLAEALNRPVGRVYQRGCDLRLGAARCGVDLSDPAYSGEGVVSAVPGPARVIVTGLTHPVGLFAGGRLVWLEGANAGLVQAVRHHGNAGGVVELETWDEAPMAVAPGDRLRAEAGCDKRLETCRTRFANLANFRGFPHLPGDDHVAGYPSEGGAHDGGSLFRA
ncbi:MAG: DUF2163 domain-containing protein [Pseudomonadota bacterium]